MSSHSTDGFSPSDDHGDDWKLSSSDDDSECEVQLYRPPELTDITLDAYAERAPTSVDHEMRVTSGFANQTRMYMEQCLRARSMLESQWRQTVKMHQKKRASSLGNLSGDDGLDGLEEDLARMEQEYLTSKFYLEDCENKLQKLSQTQDRLRWLIPWCFQGVDRVPPPSRFW